MKERKWVKEQCEIKDCTSQLKENKKVGKFCTEICLGCGEILRYAEKESEFNIKSKETEVPISKKSDMSRDECSNEILNGDTFEIMKSEPAEKYDLVLEDPPYGMDYKSRFNKFKKIENDDNLDWLEEHLLECKRIMKKNSAILVFCSEHKIEVFKELVAKHFKFKNVLIWDKGNHGAGDLKGSFGNSTEYIIYATKGKKDLIGLRESNILKVSKGATAKYQHPTQKPVELMKILLEKTVKEGDWVFDGFSGRGTVTMACISKGVNSKAVEIDKEYYKISINNISTVKKDENSTVTQLNLFG